MHAACDRAREWATADVDGELSSFERVLLNAHLEDCPSCREFHVAVVNVTDMLRSAPMETLERTIDIGRVRRRARVSLRIAPAVAAMAVTVVGLGSILASSTLKPPSNRISAPSEFAGIETMNLATAEARAATTKAASGPVRTLQARTARSLRGGPVIRR
jgi:anti-sigma factor RsiW